MPRVTLRPLAHPVPIPLAPEFSHGPIAVDAHPLRPAARRRLRRAAADRPGDRRQSPGRSERPTAPLDPPSQTLAILDDPGATTLPADRHTHVGPGEKMTGMKGMKGMDMGDAAPATRPQGGAE